MENKEFWDKWKETFATLSSDRNVTRKLMEKQELHTEFNKIMEGVELEGYDEFDRARDSNQGESGEK